MGKQWQLYIIFPLLLHSIGHLGNPSWSYGTSHLLPLPTNKVRFSRQPAFTFWSADLWHNAVCRQILVFRWKTLLSPCSIFRAESNGCGQGGQPSLHVACISWLLHTSPTQFDPEDGGINISIHLQYYDVKSPLSEYVFLLQTCHNWITKCDVVLLVGKTGKYKTTLIQSGLRTADWEIMI